MSHIKIKQVKQCAIDLFNSAISEGNLEDKVKLKVVKKNILSNKAAYVLDDEAHATIVLNLDKIHNTEKGKNYEINLFKTLNHEIEHVNLIHQNNSDGKYDYSYLMAIMEHLYYAEFFKCRLKYTPFSAVRYLFLRKQMAKNNDLSPQEICADLTTYKKLIEKYRNRITDEELQNYNKIITSLDFLNTNFEIFYNVDSEATNRFGMFICSINQYIKKNPNILEKYGILKNIYNENLELKNVYELYNSINKDNEEMYNRLILDLFTTFKMDYSEYFKDENFKKYTENLFNQYIEQSIDYYNNINIGNIYVDDKKVLMDNLKMKKRNMLIINSIAKTYGIEIIGKNMLDNNRIYTYEKKHISPK